MTSRPVKLGAELSHILSRLINFSTLHLNSKCSEKNCCYQTTVFRFILMISYICNFKQGNVDNRDGCAVFRLQNVLDEEKGWIRDQLCNSTTHRSHQKFHSQLLQFKFKYKERSSDTHYSTIQNCNNCETFAHFAVFWNWP